MLLLGIYIRYLCCCVNTYSPREDAPLGPQLDQDSAEDRHDRRQDIGQHDPHPGQRRAQSGLAGEPHRLCQAQQEARMHAGNRCAQGPVRQSAAAQTSVAQLPRGTFLRFSFLFSFAQCLRRRF